MIGGGLRRKPCLHPGVSNLRGFIQGTRSCLKHITDRARAQQAGRVSPIKTGLLTLPIDKCL